MHVESIRLILLKYEIPEIMQVRNPVSLASRIIVFFAIIFCVGCSSGSKLYPVEGKVLYKGKEANGAVVTFSTVLSKADWMAPLRYCGKNSIVIYLAFFLPMAISRTVLLRSGIITDLGTISLIVTAAGVITPLVLHWAVGDTPARFLFERPDWAHLGLRRRLALAPAE